MTTGPEGQGAGAGADFPFVRLAVGVLVLHAFLSVSYPSSPLRSAVAIGSFFAIGYCVVALIAGERVPMSAPEILAFTVGLTILMTSLSALAVSLVGIPITEFAVVVVGLPVGFLALILRRRAGSGQAAFAGFMRRWFDFSDYSIMEKRVAAVLFTAIIGALIVFLSLSIVQYPEHHSMGIAIAGPDGSVNSLPSNFTSGRAETVIVYVLGNSTPGWPAEGSGSFVLRVRLVPLNATGAEPFHNVTAASPLLLDPFGQHSESITVAVGGTSTKSFSIVIDVPGRFFLRIDLLRPAGTIVAGTQTPVTTT